MYFPSVWYSQLSSMVNIFGDSIGEEGKYVDYLDEIQASHKSSLPDST